MVRVSSPALLCEHAILRLGGKHVTYNVDIVGDIKLKIACYLQFARSIL